MLNKVIPKITNEIGNKFNNVVRKELPKVEPSVKLVLEKSPNKDILEPKVYERDWVRFGLIEKLRDNHDVHTLESLIDMDNDWERLKYICAVEGKTRKECGVEFSAENTKECVEALKKAPKLLQDFLILYKKLGMSMPDGIVVKDLGYDGVKKETVGRMIPSLDYIEQCVKDTTIVLDKNIFDEKFKGEFKTPEEHVLYVFHHELQHSRHAKEKFHSYLDFEYNGLDTILPTEDYMAWKDFKQAFVKHYNELNQRKWAKDKNIFETNLSHDDKNVSHQFGMYNMWKLPRSIERLTKKLEREHKRFNKLEMQPTELLMDFNQELLKKIKLVQKRFEVVIDIIKNEHLRGYALCNPFETIAVAAEKEHSGEALSDEFRLVLKDFDAPETKHMSYLPYNHPVMQLLRNNQKSQVIPEHKSTAS